MQTLLRLGLAGSGLRVRLGRGLGRIRVLAAQGPLGVGLIDGVLLAGTLHTDIERQLFIVNLEVVPIGLKSPGNDLQPHGVADGQHVDDGLAVLIGLQLHVAIFTPNDVEDDGGIRDGLAIDIAHHSDLNARGGRGRLELAASIGGLLLSAGSERREDQAEHGHYDTETKERTAHHRNHCKCDRPGSTSELLWNSFPALWPSRLQGKPAADIGIFYYMSVPHSYIHPTS